MFKLGWGELEQVVVGLEYLYIFKEAKARLDKVKTGLELVYNQSKHRWSLYIEHCTLNRFNGSLQQIETDLNMPEEVRTGILNGVLEQIGGTFSHYPTRFLHCQRSQLVTEAKGFPLVLVSVC